MGVKALELYQGSDWMTYRWPVAQAYDTLDRLRDLCLQRSVVPSQHGAPEELLEVVADLADDLAAELASAHADLLPFLQNNVAHRWAAFEMQLYLGEIRELAMPPSGAPIFIAAEFYDNLLLLLGRIKDILKRIDQ